MTFDRVILPSAAGTQGRKLAEFLGVPADEELDLTVMQSKLYDRLFRLGAVRNLDGSRAHRKRARERAAEKRRRNRARAARNARATRNARNRNRRARARAR